MKHSHFDGLTALHAHKLSYMVSLGKLKESTSKEKG